MHILNEIEATIKRNIPNAMILVHNVNDDGEHFEAIVISESFDTLPLLKQHQSVMKPLKEAFDSKVHALALKTYGLNKWNNIKESHPIIEQKLKEKYNDRR